MNAENIFNDIPDDLAEELSQVLITSKKVRIERIISKGHTSHEGFWYNQEENEWIIVLKGRAELLFENEQKKTKLKKGDYLNIPAHVKHRVEYTDKYTETIWLAVFY